MNGGLDINLMTAPKARGNAILEDLAWLRENDPVHWSDASNCWMLTRHQDVSDLFLGKLPANHSGRIEAFSFAALSQATTAAMIPTLVKYVPKWIINLDSAQHMRIRLLLAKAFTRPIVERVRDFAKQRVAELLDAAVVKPQVEFNEEIARVLAGEVLFQLIGMPRELFPALKDWATAIVEGLGSGRPPLDMLQRAERAAREMNDAVILELDKRRIEPRDDLLTQMLHASENADRLSVDELLAQMQIIIVAGHDTTANTLTLGLEALSRHPQQWQYLYEHPEHIVACIAELQRYVAMSGGQALLASRDFELHGKLIKRGQVVIGLIAAADRDPDRFTSPDTLDFARNNKDSLVFAPGPHFCLGHFLAKMQLAEFFSELVRRARSVEILDHELKWMPVITFRGLYALNARFNAR